MAHTPGPWHVGIVHEDMIFCDSGRMQATASGTTIYPICRMVAWDGHCEEDQANARLIAAAPRLLSELRDLCQAAEHALGGRGKDLAARRVLAQVAAARAAIVEATR